MSAEAVADDTVIDAGQDAMRQMVESLGLAAPPSGETAFAMATQGNRPEPTRAEPAAILPTDAPQETAAEAETPSSAESPVTHAQLQQLLEMVRSQPTTSQPAPKPVKPPEPPKPETLDDRMMRAQKAMAREILGVNASEAEINEVAAEAVKIMRLQDTKASIGDGGKDISAALDEELASTRRKLEERTQSVSALSEIKDQIAALQAKLDAKEQEASKAEAAKAEKAQTAEALRANEEVRKAFPGFASLVTDEASGQAVADLLWELTDGGSRKIANHLDTLVQMARGVSNTVSQPAITGSTSPATGHATRAKAAPTLTQNDATTTASASRNQDEQRELTSTDIANTGQKAMIALMAALKQRQK